MCAVVAAGALSLSYPAVSSQAAPQAPVTLVSAAASGEATGNGYSAQPAVSADGRYVTFVSDATNMVASTPNEEAHTNNVFRRDLDTGKTELVDVNLEGDHTRYAFSSSPSISADGRFVAFTSFGHDLVLADDDNIDDDVFVRDMVTGTTELVSTSLSGTTTGNDGSSHPRITPDGRYVFFLSSATDLVLGDHDAEWVKQDIYRRDLWTDTTILVSKSMTSDGGGNGPSSNPIVSDDGRYVTFGSTASDLVPNDVNYEEEDVFRRDLALETTELVSVNETGTGTGTGPMHSSSGNASASSDGRFITFESEAEDLVPEDNNYNSDIFLRDMTLGVTKLVSIDRSGTGAGDETSRWPRISGDGRYVAFQSYARNLVPGATGSSDIFVRDMGTNTTSEISTELNPNTGINGSWEPEISRDGRFVAFHSDEFHLLPNDPPRGWEDIYLKDLHTGALQLVSHTPSGTQGDDHSWAPVITPDGGMIIFLSTSSDLVVQRDTNDVVDVFAYNPASGAVDVTDPACAFNGTNCSGLTIKYRSRRHVFHGHLGTSPTSCTPNRSISLRKVRRGHDLLLGRYVTNDEGGAWRIKREVGRGRYYVRAKRRVTSEGTVCRAHSSRIIRLR